MAGTPLGYRLRLRNATDTADELVLSSVGANIADDVNRPFLTDVPSVDGASADLIAGSVDVGTSVWRVWDVPVPAVAPDTGGGGTGTGDGSGDGGTGGTGGTGACASTSITVPLPNGDLGPTGVVAGAPVAIGSGWTGTVGYAAQIIGGVRLIGDADFHSDGQRPIIDINVDVSVFLPSCRYWIVVTTTGGACIVDDGGSPIGIASGAGVVTVTSPVRGLDGATSTQQHIQIAPFDIDGDVTIASVVLQGVA